MPQADSGLNATYNNPVWTGLAHWAEASDALVINIRFKSVSRQDMMTNVFFGYSFYFPLSNMSKATCGTH